MIDKELLDLLICPACGEDSPVEPDDNGSALVCGTCRRHYPVHEGIPVMLVEEAWLPKDASSQTKSSQCDHPETGDEPRHQ